MKEVLEENKSLIAIALIIGIAGLVLTVTQTDVLMTDGATTDDHNGDAMEAQGDAMEADPDAMDSEEDMENDSMDQEDSMNDSTGQ